MNNPILLPSAKNDIREAANWYNQQQAGLGKRFTADVRKKVNSIKRNPYAWSIRYADVRTAALDIFPYLVHFIVEDKKTILVSAVLHTGRDPKTWSERTEPNI